MVCSVDSSFVSHFSDVKDPRIDRTKKHSLMNILIIALCAFIADAENFEDVEEFGEQHLDWFQSFLDLPHGIPSHDTFERVFSRLDPNQLQDAFTRWMQALHGSLEGQRVAIDGKTLRRSFDTATAGSALHLVSAWATETGLALGQCGIDKKSNEITAIPKLLDMLRLRGAIVSIDAMGCQKDIAAAIRAKQADYVLAVKKNQPTLFEHIEFIFKEADRRPGIVDDACQTLDKGHGRIETRTYQTIFDLSLVPEAQQWPGAKCVGRVISVRDMNGKTTAETRYYISSCTGSAAEFGRSVRSHWGIENGLHWVMDMTFGEDRSRTRKDYGPENLAVLRRITLNLLKKDTSKGSLRRKRKRAAWNREFLLKTLMGI